MIAGTNAETENPLFHGEVSTLNAFYRLPAADRPATRDCLFLSTHEPCSLCLSAITWAGFDNFFYLFGYEDTRDAFNIPHDLKILQEVFGVEHGALSARECVLDKPLDRRPRGGRAGNGSALNDRADRGRWRRSIRAFRRVSGTQGESGTFPSLEAACQVTDGLRSEGWALPVSAVQKFNSC